MATLYRNKLTWYLTVYYQGNRITRSLRTKDKRVARQLKPYIESELIAELSSIKLINKNLPLPELVKTFLKAKHNWSESTFKLNRYILQSHLDGKGILANPTSMAIHIRYILFWHHHTLQDLAQMSD